jgi:hypothetical protein
MITALKLLELQRHAMLMYTSCGWFFDDLSGIETVQVIQFAGRAMQLGQDLFGDSLESRFVERLSAATSNIPDLGDGRDVYEKFVRPAMVDWEQVGAHYAVSSLFENYPDQTKIYCYRADRSGQQVFHAGMAKMAVGQVKLTSEVSRESATLSYGVLHMGDHNVNGAVRRSLGDEAEQILTREAVEPFLRADFAEVIRLLDRRFGEANYSVRSLFRDEQRKILDQILTSTLDEAEALYRQIYEHRAPMMRFLTNLQIPLPKALYLAAELVLNGYLRRALEEEDIDADRVKNLLDTARLAGVALDTSTLEFAFRRNLERMGEQLLTNHSIESLHRLDGAATLFPSLPFRVDIWKVQNAFYRLRETVYPHMRRSRELGDPKAAPWVELFQSLGEKLAVKVGQ